MPCLRNRSGKDHVKQEDRKTRRRRLAAERLHAAVEAGRVPLPGTVDRDGLEIKI